MHRTQDSMRGTIAVDYTHSGLDPKAYRITAINQKNKGVFGRVQHPGFLPNPEIVLFR
ncbi:MAG: hypothetical protein IPK94_05690 [Saprospiraceae bacterium]|jgi:hypothetical protein|nr:hypothetical protein [Saprospiraceae bacterium]MBK7439157.1 hypothetical protein [Saprospiraceae bacterium]MBK8279630.1 hypothetical protein [Saprospiraceae bacterium]MBK9932391.1 hypothetical protein [Saprospiraceae bacterium]MBP7921687.1 hypothetical protein [Saprospiraceae bacterium]